MTDSGDTAPQPHPAAGSPPIPPRPPAPGSVPPPIPPYAAAPQQQYPTPPHYETQQYPTPPHYETQQYPTPSEYATLPYPAPQFAPPSGYAPPPQGYGPYVPSRAPAATAGPSGLGIVAFVLSLLAAVGATIVGCIAAFDIGRGTARELVVRPTDIDFDWSILTPVRDSVLLGEVAFWAGTVVGIWALIQGIVAIVKRRGRGWGIAAVVVAAIGPVVFAIGVQLFLAAGFASGASVGA